MGRQSDPTNHDSAVLSETLRRVGAARDSVQIVFLDFDGVLNVDTALDALPDVHDD